MLRGYIPIWKKLPFLRFLLPLITGILLQWYIQMPVKFLWVALVLSGLLLLISFLFSVYHRYKLAIINGIAITIIFTALGCLLAWYKDIRHDQAWYGKYYKPGFLLLATLQESPVEKINSYKALATITAVENDYKLISTKGNAILYFKKDSTGFILDYGSRIIFSKPLQEIMNAGNPGSFDHKRYSLFQ